MVWPWHLAVKYAFIWPHWYVQMQDTGFKRRPVAFNSPGDSMEKTVRWNGASIVFSLWILIFFVDARQCFRLLVAMAIVNHFFWGIIQFRVCCCFRIVSSAWNNNACAAASLSPPTVTFMEDESGNFAENIFYLCHEPKAYLENNFIFVLCAAKFVRSLAPREIFNYYYLTYFRTVNMIYFMQGKPFVSNVWMDAVDLYRYHVQS